MYLILLLNQDVRILNEYWLKFFHGKESIWHFTLCHLDLIFNVQTLYFSALHSRFLEAHITSVFTMLPQEFPVQSSALISLIALFATLLHTIFFSLSLHPPIPLCFDPLPYRDVAAMATSESSSTVCSPAILCSHLLIQQGPPPSRPALAY